MIYLDLMLQYFPRMEQLRPVGDSPSEVAHEAMVKFPNCPMVIKYNGKKEAKPLEYCFMTLAEFHGWKDSQFQSRSYFLFPITLIHKTGEIPLTASHVTVQCIPQIALGDFL